MADMIDYLRKPVRAVIRNLAILPSVDPNRLLPLGGTTGQFPMKASDEDGDIVWADFQVDDELSLDSEFPVQNKVLASEIYQLQSQLDGIPFPSSDDPLMDGEADPGESTDFARADHVHPSDTSKADVEDVPTKTSDLTNDSGFITASDVPEEIFWATYGTTTKAEIETALANNLFVCCKYNSAVYFLSDRSFRGASIFTYTFVGMTTTDGLYIGPQIQYLKLVYTIADGGTNTWSNGTRIVPDLATDTPSALGTAAVGTSKKVARSDHVHSMPTAADVGAIADPGSGTTGQVLKKTANGTEWANESGGAATVLSGTKSGSSVSVSSVDPVALYNTTAGTSVVLSIGKKRYNLHECGYRHSMDENEYTFYFYGADATDGLVQITLKGSVYDDDPSGTTTTLYGTYKYSSVTWTT